MLILYTQCDFMSIFSELTSIVRSIPVKQERNKAFEIEPGLNRHDAFIFGIGLASLLGHEEGVTFWGAKFFELVSLFGFPYNFNI